MATIPLSPIFLKSYQFQKDDGTPADSYRLYCYIAGTETPTTLFTDSDGSTPADNPYELNADGRPDDTLYLPADIGVKLILTDEDGPDSPTPIPPGGVTISTDDNISNPGSVAFNNFGNLILQITQFGMDEGEQIDAGVTYATIDGTTSPTTTIYMPSAATCKFFLTTLNVSETVNAQLVRDGTDIFLGGDEIYDLPAGTLPIGTGVTWISNGSNTWYPFATITST